MHLFSWKRGVLVQLRLVLFLWDLLFGWMDTKSSHATEQSRDGLAVAFALQLNPKHDKPVVRIATVHIPDEPNLLFGVLVKMGMRASGVRVQGLGMFRLSDGGDGK